ncbi:MAG: calcium/sodium antiporter [Verrucomicrobia bacterium]|nr:calcium/sodium antiporter [Verrucomicrobiota bacterium]
MAWQLLWLLIGLALIIKGGDLFVGASVRIAEFLHMPRVVIGSTLVSLATTSPELVVSLMAGYRGESGLAVGNAVGSCLCNIGLILGAAAAFKHIDTHPPVLRLPLLAMFGFGALLFGFTLDLELARWQGALLVALGVGYFAYDFTRHRRKSQANRRLEAEARQALGERERLPWLRTRWGTGVQFVLGAGVVVCGSRLLVDSAVALAGALGVPAIVIGLTVVALGTSLPEFITAVTSSRQNVSDLAVGNILGANIANLSMVVGAAALLHPVVLDRPTQVFSFPMMVLGMLLLLWMLLTDRRITRREGLGLLAFYGVYLVGAVLLGLTHAL